MIQTGSILTHTHLVCKELEQVGFFKYKLSISSCLPHELCCLCSFTQRCSFQMSVLFVLEMRNMYQMWGDVSFITGSNCPSISPPTTDRYGRVLSAADTVVTNGHCGCECVSLSGQIKQNPLSLSLLSNCILPKCAEDVSIR